ncbi:hypothetical protein E4U42_001608 [Claviceps africana]|uniref:HECT-type E3 ubiquitin transferase n=1 Tax=Claviceps africana TaxID=83212 RepID=A0A8K0JBX5_9HYPO|nr:hypothetical protein E4U42_001608 [Claviceps africana]
MASSSSHSRPRPSRGDLVTRIHTDALDTPTTLPGSFDLSNSRPAEDPSSSESDSQPRSRSKSARPLSRHARSISNPFPSFLHGPFHKKAAPSRPDANGSKGGHPDAGTMAGPSLADSKHKRHPTGSKDFATGNCMACGSLMRWPRELKVFKCTICATINDLAVPAGDSGRLALRERRRAGASQASSDGLTCQALSTQHFRAVARQCIRSYISNKLVPEKPAAVIGSGIAAPDNKTGHRHPRPQACEASFDGLRLHEPSLGGTEIGDYTSKYVFEHQPTLRPNPSRPNAATRSFSSSYPERPPPPVPSLDAHMAAPWRGASPPDPKYEPKRIFKQLEEHVTKAFGSLETINSSFLSRQPAHGVSGSSAGGGVGTEKFRRRPVPSREGSCSRTGASNPKDEAATDNSLIDEIDAKMLLLGDVAENGLWWTGGRSQLLSKKPTLSPSSASTNRAQSPQRKTSPTRSPNIDWDELESWYDVAVNPAKCWFSVYEDVAKNSNLEPASQEELELLEHELLQGQSHAQRVLLKAIESLLKRPGRPLTSHTDIRFLLIMAENPMLHPTATPFRGMLQSDTAAAAAPPSARLASPGALKRNTLPSSGLLSGQHSGIVKRIIGLLSNTPAECHNQFIAWSARFGSQRFTRIKDLVSGFLSYRLLRQIDKKHHAEVDITAGLIPELRTGRAAGAGFYLHDEIRTGGAPKKREPEQKIAYTEDWQVKAASRVLALLFAANNSYGPSHGSAARLGDNVAVGSTRQYGPSEGQLLPTSDFYNSMIDYADLVSDFESWESKRTKFSFCQYPFLMSIWAKTHILEHDARRQMQMKARDAFLNSIMTNRNIQQYLSLNVRRDCLVEDSLAAVSEVIGSGTEDIKKALRITFKGEEGIDAGGLRKEWFLLLVREVFNPDHGLFLYDEDSQYCYFNPSTFETSDQFFLVGVVMGLAIYNSTILDVALPPFAFRKLLAAAPAHGLGMSSRPRPWMQYTLEDLAEYRPRVAQGLRQLLEFEGDVESTFCLDFVIDTDKFGTTVQVPLCPGGERKPVTNSNRREYVELYIRYLLDTAVTRQFEPFKRGFYTVCGGNAFSLFRPEEIELLIRGSDEALDIAALRAVAEYDNWGHAQPDDKADVVVWFWETFQEAAPRDQRKLLSFITGSDRIPATGAAMLPIKVSCLGADSGRYPIARTCFNMISLWEYGTKQRLEEMLWRAVFESEGFGLK